MSASDAAPLPRLGEVFFDVRGNSRSMRLSWYADTDVAVFSIWQGGKCTGTFRLPMDDLSRMIEILRRGPDSRAGRGMSERRPPERGTGERWAQGPRDRGYESEKTVVHNADPDDYGAPDYGAGDYGPDNYGAPDYRPADYDGYGQSRSARHRTERHEPADYQQHDQDGEWWPDSDSAGYGEQRFAPPYVRPRPGSSEPGFMDDPEYGLPADPGGRSRHSTGRHSGGQAQ
jgi:hypothetical protein